MSPEEQVPQQISPVAAGASVVREQDKIMLILSYLGIFALIPWLTVNDSDYVRWHAKNGFVLGVGGSVALMILGMILMVIPIVGGLLSCVLWPGLLVIDLIAMIKSLRGERWRIPVVSDLSEKF